MWYVPRVKYWRLELRTDEERWKRNRRHLGPLIDLVAYAIQRFVI